MRLLSGTLLLIMTLAAQAAHEPPACEASFQKRVDIETRRFLPACLKLENPAPCIVDNGYQCLDNSSDETKIYVCLRKYSGGSALLTISKVDTNWVSKFTWDPG